eukprot:14399225-Alexandrium_andersonii.AAC.1
MVASRRRLREKVYPQTLMEVLLVHHRKSKFLEYDIAQFDRTEEDAPTCCYDALSSYVARA